MVGTLTLFYKKFKNTFQQESKFAQNWQIMYNETEESGRGFPIRNGASELRKEEEVR